MEHFVRGVLTVEDEVYIGEPDLRLANGQTIRLLYSDLRSDEELSRRDDNQLCLLLEPNKWFELLLIVQLGLGKAKKVTYSANLPPGTHLKLATNEDRKSRPGPKCGRTAWADSLTFI